MSKMVANCSWCGKELVVGDSLLCPDCVTKRNAKRAEMVAAKAARDAAERAARWNPLAELPVIVPAKPCGNGKTTYVRCPGCHQEVTTTSLEMYINCPNCGEKLQLRQAGKPDIPARHTTRLPAHEQPHNRPKKGDKRMPNLGNV